MSTISQMDIMHEFFSDNDQLRFDDEPHRIFADLKDKSSDGKEIVIKRVPRLTYTEGDIGDSFIPYDVERVLVEFLKDLKNVLKDTFYNDDQIIFTYNEVEEYFKSKQMR